MWDAVGRAPSARRARQAVGEQPEQVVSLGEGVAVRQQAPFSTIRAAPPPALASVTKPVAEGGKVHLRPRSDIGDPTEVAAMDTRRVGGRGSDQLGGSRSGEDPGAWARRKIIQWGAELELGRPAD